MSGKQAPLIIRQDEGLDYTPGELVDARVETSDVARAAFDLAQVDTAGGALWDTLKASALDVDGEQISPQDLNEKYGLEDTFQVPMTEAAAAVIAERANRRKNAEEVLSRAEQGLINTTVSFGASIAANMLDPLNLAADIAVGKGLGSLAKSGKIALMTGWGARGASIGRRFGEAAVEGALGSLAVEPLVFGARSLENKDRGLDEVAMETLAGALAFPAVKFGGEAVLSRGLKFWDGLDTRSASNLYRSAKAQLMQGRKINIEPLTREQIKMTSEYEVPEGKALFGSKTQYDYVKKASLKPNDTFYVSVTNNVDSLDGAKFGTFSDNYGGEIKLTDNGFAANGASARITSESVGRVLEVKVDPSARILDLDSRYVDLDVDAKKSIAEAYEAATGLQIKDADGLTIKQIYDDLYDGVINEKYKDDITKDFNTKLKEAGYDGYIHDGSKLAEMDHNPHNVIELFDTNKVEVVKSNKADPAFVRRLSSEERLDIMRNSLDDGQPGFFDDDKSARQIEQELQQENFLNTQQEIEDDLLAFRELDPDKVNEDIEVAFKNEAIDEAEYKKFKNLMKEKEAIAKAETEMFNCIYGGTSSE